MTKVTSEIKWGLVAPLALLLGLLLIMAEAWALMLATGAVWHETGWLAPISYAGALVVTWLLYVVKMIFNRNNVEINKKA